MSRRVSVAPENATERGELVREVRGGELGEVVEGASGRVGEVARVREVSSVRIEHDAEPPGAAHDGVVEEC